MVSNNSGFNGFVTLAQQNNVHHIIVVGFCRKFSQKW